MSRNLTKSRFKVGYECPSKLFYLDNKKFGNLNAENSFLEALAEGGFQVGELAKVYHPGGIEITSANKDQAVTETAELLKRDKVTIFEATIRHENLFIKADVLVKSGSNIQLIEVKAKSFDPTERNPFFTKASVKKNKPQLNSQWEPYIMDVAFQAFVIQQAFPDFEVEPFLMLADKTSIATVDGINQRFFLDSSVGGRVSVITAPGTTAASLGAKLLVKVSVSKEVEVAWASQFRGGHSFSEFVSYLSSLLETNTLAEPVVSGGCKSCEFRIGADLKSSGLLSGFENCWSKARGIKAADFSRPMVFDIWNFRRSELLLAQEKVFIDQVERDDIDPREGADGLSASERQWLQVEKIIAKESTPYFDSEGMAEEMERWRFPLHFIDFETTMVAIPFHAGCRPYEQIAFQFSHHCVNENGTVEHAGEYLNREKGKYPNFDFVRNLKRELEDDNGTIFRFAAHENTVLCQIRQQLLSTDDVSDSRELVAFIESITASTDSAESEWLGPRNMIDMCELVKLFYYHPPNQWFELD